MSDDTSPKHSILIVDDAPENLDVLKRALIDDYVVRPAVNGPLALRLAAMEPHPDLILLDIMMPGMDGYEVCRQLKGNFSTRDIPVIFITVRGSAEDELAGFQLGAVDYITKPISPYIVRARVKNHLMLRDFNREMEEKNRRLYEINEQLSISMEQLSSSEERFRSLVQTIPDIVYKIDSEGKFTFLNRSVERLGYHQSELIGKHFSEIIHSTDIPNASLQQVIEKLGAGTANPGQKVFDERRSGIRMTVGLEIRLKTKSGRAAEFVEIKNINDSTISVEVNSTGLYGVVGHDTSYCKRQYVGTVGVIRDVTDRHKVQKAFMDERMLLRQLIDAVPLPIFFMGDRERITFSNEAFRDFFGIKEGDHEGSTLEKMLGVENKRQLEIMVSESSGNLDCLRICREVSLVCRQGDLRNINCILSKFQRTNPEEVAIIGVLVDITEQKIFTARLIEARKNAEKMAQRAESASLAKGDFLANMSHEIRTPLNAVIGLTHLCLQTPLTGQQKDYLDKVVISANTLLLLINDILDFSKIEAGKLSMENSEFSLDDVLGGIVALMAIRSREKGLELLIDNRSDVPMRLKGDSHRLGQIFTNLVGNAIKFTEHGEIVISSEVLAIDTDSVFLQFSVRDTGIGMGSEQMDKLFHEFSQGDTSTTRKYGGTGLGLAISKRLVEMMDGKISVESQLGCGSCFSFTARFGKASGWERELPILAQSLRDLKVVVVDDNATARGILSQLLRTLSCDPVVVASGREALEVLTVANASGRGVDLVLVDWGMPEMNGLETIQRIKEDLVLAHVPKTIMVTAYDREDVIFSSDALGPVDGFLLKPVHLASLFNAIMAVYGNSVVDSRSTDRKRSAIAFLAGARVMLVEDNEINQQVARELLEQVHVYVTIANHGQEAVNLANAAVFDGILMDMQMPVMDGLEATRKIRQHKSAAELPIIAMTANAMSGDREKCLLAGMNDHVAKPVVPDELYAALERWIKKGDSGPSHQPVSVISRNDGAVLLPPLPEIDVTVGLRHVGGKVAVFMEVLSKFVKNQGDAIRLLQRQWESADLPAMEQTAHAMKGVSATIGAKKLADLAACIERQVKSREKMGEITDLLIETAIEMERVISAIKTKITMAAPVAQEQTREEIHSESLANFFLDAQRLLLAFDSEVEEVVARIAPLVHRQERRKRLKSIQDALGSYDYETCLQIFQEWATEEGISLRS